MKLFRKRTAPPNVEAQRAEQESRERLKAIEDRWPTVHEESTWHRLRRERNHFGADLQRLMRGDAT